MSTEPHKARTSADGTLMVTNSSSGQFLGNPPLCVAPVELTGRSAAESRARGTLPITRVIGWSAYPGAFRLRAPLTVQLRVDGDDVVVWHEVLPGEGRGPSLGVAVDRFRSRVSQRYLSLRAEAGPLGEEAARELELLQQYLEDRR